MSKTTPESLFETFYRTDNRRVSRYVAMVARMHHMPMSLLPDLRQAAWLEASIAMRYWCSSGGKSLFNWCAGPMRRGIIRCYRSSCGARPYAKDAIPFWSDLKSKHVAAMPADMADRIDLHRALAADPKPKQIMRLIMCALSVSNGAEIARESGIRKQVVCEHMSKARARLRATLTM